MKNVITWFEIPTNNFDRAVKFYSEILGEEVKVEDFMGQQLGFFAMDSMEGVGGNIMPPDQNFKPSTNGARVYFNCQGKLDQVLARVEKAGGKIIKPKINIGQPGWIALISDSEGNIAGLHSAV
ncbi:MAG: VOC family protein [bacterium]|nr:VOC family protein [bacterium]